MPTLAAGIILAILITPAEAADVKPLCSLQLRKADGQLVFTEYSPDPAVLAETWMPQFERLDNAIPQLSPREERWLEEKMQASGERVQRAVSSREYALQKAKADVGVLVGLTRKTIQVRDPREQTKTWILLAYTLVESDAALHLAHLVSKEIIPLAAIPGHWRWFKEGKIPDQDIFDYIRWGRQRLARHILGCTVLSLLEVAGPR